MQPAGLRTSVTGQTLANTTATLPFALPAFLPRHPSAIPNPETGNAPPMPTFPPSHLPALLLAGLLTLAAQPSRADDTEAAPKGAAVTVLKATKSCFANIVELSGTIIPREEAQVRPERMGLKVAEMLADAGGSVRARQG